MRLSGITVFSIAIALIAAVRSEAIATEEVAGRTGLPVVRVGGQKVWMESGDVRLYAEGANLRAEQDFRLRFPAGKLEKKSQIITVAVREDYYRKREKGDPAVSDSEAKGFKSFSVSVDGKSAKVETDDWHINDKGDTATRWRHWEMLFKPGQAHRLRIASSASLGIEGGKRYVQFVTRDLGHWRDTPDSLEIKLKLPRKMEAKVAGVEPKPTDISAGGIRWVWRKATPKRDIFVLLPATK